MKKGLWLAVIAALFAVSARGTEPGTNFLYNGGFEKETNPGMADGWGPFFWGWGMRGETSFYQDLETLMHPDTEEAFEGRKSMRMVLPPKLRTLDILHPYVTTMTPGREAVFSAYLKTIKGRHAKVCFRMRFLDAPGKTFTVDDQWRRYEMKFKIPAKGMIQPMIQLADGIAVWIDAAKLEYGSKATAFVPFEEKAQKTSQTAERPPVPHYRIPVADEAPVLTGTMSSPVWEKALKIDDFHLLKSGEPVAKSPTRTRLLIHGTTLYAAAECLGPSGEPLIRQRDGSVYGDDCFELFLDPGNPAVHDDQKKYGSYYHFVVNSAGTVYDVYTGGETRPFNADIRTRTSRTEDRWICEMAIDLASLNVNPIKSEWRFLLGREDYTSGQFSANVPLPKSFHDYDRFPEAEVPHALIEKLNAVQTRRPEFDGSGLTLRIGSAKRLTAKYDLTVSRDGKKLLRQTDRLELGPTERTLRIPLPAGGNGAATVELAVQGDSGERLVRSWTISRDSGNYFRRNYYTSERQAELIWNGEPPEDGGHADFNGRKVAWQKADGKLLFDLSGVPDGVYPVRIGGKSVPFAKHPPKANEVKIDRLNNILLVNGKPFIFYGPFVFFSFHQRFALETRVVKDLKRRGFNGLVLWVDEGYVPGSWAEKNVCFDSDWYKKMLDVCDRHGLKMILMCNLRVRNAKFVSVNNPKTLIPKLKDHPALLAWYFYDEPTAESRAQVLENFRYTRAADPYHPFQVNLTPQGLFAEVVKDRKSGRNPFDILSLTFYPISRTTDPNARPRDKVRNFEKMREGIRKEQGVLYHAAQSFGYGADWWYREPTQDEISFLIYMPLIYGNTGWMWFDGRAKSRTTQEAIESYIPELNFMQDLIGGGEALRRGEVFTSLCGNVLGTLRRYKGKYYLLTVNQSDRAVKTRFNLPSLLPGSPKEAEVLFEGRTCDLTNDDRYGPYQRHVYVFELR